MRVSPRNCLGLVALVFVGSWPFGCREEATVPTPAPPIAPAGGARPPSSTPADGAVLKFCNPLRRNGQSLQLTLELPGGARLEATTGTCSPAVGQTCLAVASGEIPVRLLEGATEIATTTVQVAAGEEWVILAATDDNRRPRLDPRRLKPEFRCQTTNPLTAPDDGGAPATTTDGGRTVEPVSMDAGPAPAPDTGPAPPPPATGVEGSFWELTRSGGIKSLYEFKPGGQLHWTYLTGSDTGLFNIEGTWSQDGSAVKMRLNEGFVEETGTVMGDVMTGVAVTRNGGRWTFDGRRVPAPPPPKLYKVGLWSGQSSQGLPLSFEVDATARRIMKLNYEFSAPSCGYSSKTTVTGRMAIHNDQISSETVGGGCWSGRLAGRFVGASRAEGTLDVTFNAGLSCPCTGSLSLTWTADAP